MIPVWGIVILSGENARSWLKLIAALMSFSVAKERVSVVWKVIE